VWSNFVFQPSPPNIKSHIFGSTKHIAVVEMAKYSVFKGEISNQSFHDALSISALFLCKQNFRECSFLSKHALASVNNFVCLSSQRAQTKM